MVNRLVILLFLLGIFEFNTVLGDEILQDPTAPIIGNTTTDHMLNISDGLRLQAIIVTPTKKVAVINTKTYKIGDYIGDYQIINIIKSCILLQNKETKEKIRLSLYSMGIKNNG